MDVVVIPLSGGQNTHYSQITALDGRDFSFKLEWNERASAWFLSITDANDSPIVDSQKMVIDVDLLDGLVGNARPVGKMILLDVSGGYREATFESLGDTHQLHYITP